MLVAACQAPPIEIAGGVYGAGARPMAAGVEVRLERLEPGGQPPLVIFTTLTDGEGRYRIELFPPEQPGPPLLVGVGAGEERMRAFALGVPNDVDPASEAAVRLVLASAVPLPRWSVAALRAVNEAVAAAARGAVGAGDSIDVACRAAEEAARRSPAVTAALRPTG